MGTSMVGENKEEYVCDLALNPVYRLAEARERSNLTGRRSGGVTVEVVEDEEQTELESGGGERQTGESSSLDS